MFTCTEGIMGIDSREEDEREQMGRKDTEGKTMNILFMRGCCRRT